MVDGYDIFWIANQSVNNLYYFLYSREKPSE